MAVLSHQGDVVGEGGLLQDQGREEKVAGQEIEPQLGDAFVRHIVRKQGEALVAPIHSRSLVGKSPRSKPAWPETGLGEVDLKRRPYPTAGVRTL